MSGTLYGWLRDPVAVEKFQYELLDAGEPHVFGDTPVMDDAQADVPDDIFGWRYITDLAGWIDENQLQVGSCVGFGTSMAVEGVEGAEIRVNGDLETFTRYSREVTYGGSRVEIGQGRIRGDGSVGAWAAKFVTQYGMVPRQVIGAYDLREYSEGRCRDFGRIGVPDELEVVARQFPVQATTLVENVEQAWKAIGNLNFIAICSDIGFDSNRDKDGICRIAGSWGHCMCVLGRAIINGVRCYFIQNSWGARNNGPIGYGNHPAGGFWVTESSLQRILSQGDSWAFSGAKGFPVKKINWKDM